MNSTPEARNSISFGCEPSDGDVPSTVASDSGELMGDLCSSLPSSGQEKCTSPSYRELLDITTRTVDKLGLEWDSKPTQNQAQSKLDDRFLTSRAPAQPHKPLPFFQDLHQEVFEILKAALLGANITNAAATDLSWKRLSPPNSAPALKSHPLLPSKPCRITSALVGKSYMARFTAFVENLRAVKQHSAVFGKLIPHRSREFAKKSFRGLCQSSLSAVTPHALPFSQTSAPLGDQRIHQHLQFSRFQK